MKKKVMDKGEEKYVYQPKQAMVQRTKSLRIRRLKKRFWANNMLMVWILINLASLALVATKNAFTLLSEVI